MFLIKKFLIMFLAKFLGSGQQIFLFFLARKNVFRETCVWDLGFVLLGVLWVDLGFKVGVWGTLVGKLNWFGNFFGFFDLFIVAYVAGFKF